MDNQIFRQMCENKMTSAEFNNLHTLAGVKKYSITKALKKPSMMSLPLLKVFAAVLKVEVSELILAYGCGLEAMTAKEYLAYEKGKQKVLPSLDSLNELRHETLERCRAFDELDLWELEVMIDEMTGPYFAQLFTANGKLALFNTVLEDLGKEPIDDHYPFFQN